MSDYKQKYEELVQSSRITKNMACALTNYEEGAKDTLVDATRSTDNLLRPRPAFRGANTGALFMVESSNSIGVIGPTLPYHHAIHILGSDGAGVETYEVTPDRSGKLVISGIQSDYPQHDRQGHPVAPGKDGASEKRSPLTSPVTRALFKYARQCPSPVS